MKKGIITTLVVAMVFIFAGMVLAGPYERDAMPPKCMRMHRAGFMPMLKALDLTPDQRDRVEAIKAQHKDEREALRKKITADRRNVGNAVFSDEFNENNIREASKAVSEDMENQAVLRAKTMAGIRAVLTPEQLEKWKKYREKRRKRNFGKMGKRCPMSDGG